MATAETPVREFFARKNPMSGDYTPQFTSLTPIPTNTVFQDIINEDRMSTSAPEYQHLVERFLTKISEMVAADEQDRVVSGTIKVRANAFGHLKSPADPWNETCGSNITIQLLSNVTKKGSAEISHRNVDESPRVKVDNVTYIGAVKAKNAIQALTDIGVYGTNVQFDAALGDEAWLSYEDAAGSTVKVALVCKSSGSVCTVFYFPDEILALETNSKLKFTMVSRAGNAEGRVFTSEKSGLVYSGYTGEAYVWNISTEGLARDTVKVDDTKLVTVNGAALQDNIDVRLTLTCKDGASGTVTVSAADLVSNTADALTLHFTQAMIDATAALKDHDLAGATGSLMVRGAGGVVEDYAFQYAE